MLLTRVGRLFSAQQPVLEDVDVLIRDGLVAEVGESGSVAVEEDPDEYDCGGALLTAGLVDAHTHPVYARPRLAEVAARSRGADYAEIAEKGGGITATRRETKAASWPSLERDLRLRLQSWLEAGTTTVEAKTGYWLDEEGELGAVELLQRLRSDSSLPHVAITFLGAHSLPPEFAQDRHHFVEAVASWGATARRRGADFADVFCDRGAFSVPESRQILVRARGDGLGLRIHADELALTGGTRLAVELRAASADHLLRIGDEEIRLLANSQTVATLCPVTALSMGVTPPARRLVDAGVTLALGSDHNPGTSGATSMALILWLAVSELGLSIEEGLEAATLGGARSLRIETRGRIARGMEADLVLWDADHEGAFAWNPVTRPLQVWRAGRLCSPEPPAG
ncbi:MAG: imidazolonepropionase [Candidatus Dormibacteria bacterium]